MTQHDWILGLPVQTDDTNFEWSLGMPHIITEQVAAQGVMSPYYYKTLMAGGLI